MNRAKLLLIFTAIAILFPLVRALDKKNSHSSNVTTSLSKIKTLTRGIWNAVWLEEEGYLIFQKTTNDKTLKYRIDLLNIDLSDYDLDGSDWVELCSSTYIKVTDNQNNEMQLTSCISLCPNRDILDHLKSLQKELSNR